MTSKIAQIIDRERIKLGLSQIEVLEKAGLSSKAVGRTWARLRSNRIGISDLLSICKVVKVDLRIYNGSQIISWITFEQINMKFSDVMQVCKAWRFDIVAFFGEKHGEEITAESVPESNSRVKSRKKSKLKKS